MLVAEYIKKNGFAPLLEAGITVGDYFDLLVLNYSQISTPKHNPVFDACRGLILRKDTLEVASRAFDRFYNYGEDPNSESFPFDQAVIWEKVDGSLISFRRDAAGWSCSTRKCAYAEGETPSGISFYSLVSKAFDENMQERLSILDSIWSARPFTLICELVSPESRIVKPYPEAKLFVLAVRFLDGPEMSIQEVDAIAEKLRLDRPKRYRFASLDTLREFKDLDAFDEGYVLQAPTAPSPWRIKVKNPAYLAIAHLRENGAISYKRVVSLIFSGDEEEYLQYFPEDRVIFSPWLIAYGAMKQEVLALFKKYNYMEVQKDFALAIKERPCAGILFGMRQGKTLEEALSRLSDDSKTALLEKYK